MCGKLLLLSNSTNLGENYLQYPRPHIMDFLGKSLKRVLFVPYAAVDFTFDLYEQITQHAFGHWGYELTGIHRFEDQKAAVEEAEAIVVGGGNSFALLQRVYKHDLIKVIRKKVSGGTPYIGWSAGSNLACPTIKTTNDMPIMQPPSFEALGMVSFQINPHYTEATIPNHGGESRNKRIKEFTVLNPELYVVGLPEGMFLKVENDQLFLGGSGTAKIFKHKKEDETFVTGDDLDFLLKA